MKLVDFLDFLENINIEDFDEPTKRQKLFKEFANFLSDSNMADTIFALARSDSVSGQTISDTDLQKLNKFREGMTPAEFASLLVTDAPTAIKSKANTGLTHVQHFQGKPGAGKTTTLYNVLSAINGLTFYAAKSLLDKKDKDSIVKNVSKMLDNFQETFKAAGFENIDKEKQASQLVDAAKDQADYIPEDSKKMQRDTLNAIKDNINQDKLANSPSFTAKIGSIDPKTNIIDLVSILPGTPAFVQDDMFQNITDPKAIANLIQSLGERNLPTGLAVFTSNYSEEAARTLQETFGANPGAKGRAGIFVSLANSKEIKTDLDKVAARKYMSDLLFSNLVNEVAKYSKTKKDGKPIKSGILRALSDAGKSGTIAELESALDDIAKNTGFGDLETMAKGFDKFLETVNTQLYRNKDIAKSGQLLASLRAKLDEIGERDLLDRFENVMSDVMNTDLSIGNMLKTTDANEPLNENAKKGLANIFNMIVQGNFDKINETIDEKVEDKKKDVIDEGRSKIGEFFDNIKNSMEKIKDKQAGKFVISDIDKAGKKIEETGQKTNVDTLQSLNHRGICSLSKENEVILGEGALSARQIKQMFDTLQTLKEVLPDEDFKAQASKLVLGTFGFTEIGRQMLDSFGITGKGIEVLTDKQITEKFTKDLVEQDGKDIEKLGEIFKEASEALQMKAVDEENKISDFPSLLDSVILEGTNKFKENLVKDPEKALNEIPDEFKAIGKLMDLYDRINEDNRKADNGEIEETLMEKIAEKLDEEAVLALQRLKPRIDKLMNNILDSEKTGLPEVTEDRLKKTMKEIKDELCKKTGGNLKDALEKSIKNGFNDKMSDSEFYGKSFTASLFKLFR